MRDKKNGRQLKLTDFKEFREITRFIIESSSRKQREPRKEDNKNTIPEM